jgi:hypothetical protein
VTDVHENVRIAAVWRNKTESAVFEVVSNRTCGHSSISMLFAVRGGMPRKKHPTASVPAKATKYGGHGFVGCISHPTNW